MKLSRSLAAGVSGFALLALGSFVGGCASPSGDSSAPKPGRGIAEYRALVREAQSNLTAMVEGLQAFDRSSTITPSLAGFDRALHHLEVTSVKTRARADAIMARGQAYFDEWKEHLAAITNQAAGRTELERYTRLFDSFERVRQQSGDVRDEFRPFMAKLRDFRAQLDHTPPPSASELREEREELKASGRGVLKGLDAIAITLDEAQSALPATQGMKQ
jgi:hypothetical protein